MRCVATTTAGQALTPHRDDRSPTPPDDRPVTGSTIPRPADTDHHSVGPGATSRWRAADLPASPLTAMASTMPRVTAHPLIPTHQRSALRSTVALKAVMAVSGLTMVLYLLAHMYGNLKVFSGQAAFDDYAHHLRTLGMPFLPYSGALWTIRAVLLGSVLVHIYAAVALWSRARRTTTGGGGRRYQSTKAARGVQRTYASFTMRWGGVIVALFIVYHLLHLTTNTIHPGGASSSSYQRVVSGFELWWVVFSYTIAVVAVGFHLRHGFWSAFATLGFNTSVRRRRHLNVAATVVALVVTVGFLVPPFSILLGWVG